MATGVVEAIYKLKYFNFCLLKNIGKKLRTQEKTGNFVLIATLCKVGEGRTWYMINKVAICEEQSVVSRLLLWIIPDFLSETSGID